MRSISKMGFTPGNAIAPSCLFSGGLYGRQPFSHPVLQSSRPLAHVAAAGIYPERSRGTAASLLPPYPSLGTPISRLAAVPIDPCIPRSWNGYSITFRYHSAVYKIREENPANVMRGVALTKIDGKLLEGSANIPLTDDGAEHNILIVSG
jgi:hypothetical protein